MSKKEEMFSLVEQWRGSGLTRREFANRHGLKDSSFKNWCAKQYNEVVKSDQETTFLSKSEPEALGFIELNSDSDMHIENKPLRVDLELPGGIRIKIY